MRVYRLVELAVAVFAAMTAGCASTSGGQPAPAARAAPAPAHEHGMGAMAMCPMQVPGTKVAAADVEGGVALSFTTSTGDVSDLRQRVRRMAEMHNQHHSGGMMMGGHHGPGEHEHEGGSAAGHECCGGAMMRGGMTMMPAATASAEDIQDGARLVLRPTDPAQLGALREHIRMHAARMARGECPMMGPTRSSSDEGHEAHHPAE